jgi:hypothetical protein
MNTILYNIRLKEAASKNHHKSGGKPRNANGGTFFYNNERYLDEMQKKYQNFIVDEEDEQREKEFAEMANAPPKQRSFSCRQYPSSSSRALSSVYTNSGITTIGEIMEHTTQNSNYTNELHDVQSSSSSASSFSKSSGSSISAVVANVASSNHVHVLTEPNLTDSYTSATVDSGRESIVESPNSNLVQNSGGSSNGKPHLNVDDKYVNFSLINHHQNHNHHHQQGTVNVQLANKQSLDTRC